MKIYHIGLKQLHKLQLKEIPFLVKTSPDETFAVLGFKYLQNQSNEMEVADAIIARAQPFTIADPRLVVCTDGLDPSSCLSFHDRLRPYLGIN